MGAPLAARVGARPTTTTITSSTERAIGRIFVLDMESAPRLARVGEGKLEERLRAGRRAPKMTASPTKEELRGRPGGRHRPGGWQRERRCGGIISLRRRQALQIVGRDAIYRTTMGDSASEMNSRAGSVPSIDATQTSTLDVVRRGTPYKMCPSSSH